MSDRDGNAPVAAAGGWRAALIRPLVLVLRLVTGVALVAMIVATVVDVIGRHFFASPLPGVVDMIEFAMVWTTFLGFALAFATGAHISLDIIDGLVGPRTLAIIQGANRLVATAAVAGLCWLAWTEFLDKLDWGDRTIDLRIPLTWFWSAVVLGFALSVVFLLVPLAADPSGPRKGPDGA